MNEAIVKYLESLAEQEQGAVTETVQCPNCNGTGEDVLSTGKRCEMCEGSGLAELQEATVGDELAAPVPASGVQDPKPVPSAEQPAPNTLTDIVSSCTEQERGDILAFIAMARRSDTAPLVDAVRGIIRPYGPEKEAASGDQTEAASGSDQGKPQARPRKSGRVAKAS